MRRQPAVGQPPAGPGDPLVLVNAWDAGSARAVEDAGAAAIATSSFAVAAAQGFPDDRTTPLDVVFGTVARIAAAVSVPVTADLLDGYGLPPENVVDRLLAAGAVGCNIEDTDHDGPASLLDPAVAADRLRAVRAAALDRGVPIVLNARVDTYVPAAPDTPEEVLFADVVRRARHYLDAGADCVYPIRLTDPVLVTGLVAELGAPVNANVAPGGRVADVAAAGAARVSFGPMPHGVALRAVGDLARRALHHDRGSRTA